MLLQLVVAYDRFMLLLANVHSFVPIVPVMKYIVPLDNKLDCSIANVKALYQTLMSAWNKSKEIYVLVYGAFYYSHNIKTPLHVLLVYHCYFYTYQ